MGYTCRAVGTDHFGVWAVSACVPPSVCEPYPRTGRSPVCCFPDSPRSLCHALLHRILSPFAPDHGTGGTIAGVAPSAGSTAGYQSGALSIGQILDSVPGLSALVPEGRLATEQVFSIPSEQMSGAHWLQLAGRLRAWLNGDKAPDAIVITHGTDTLEETAFFLSLVLPPTRSVLLTGV